jgi:MEMO1 family protein
MAIRERAVYPTQPEPLRMHLAELLEGTPREEIDGTIMAVIVPDTNLLAGGEVASAVYKALEGQDFETVILISPSHTGPFKRLNICSVDEYRTPLGPVAVNDRLRNELCDEDDDIYLDDTGHFHTEGVDVQLPFLQTMLKDFDIVPIVMGDESPEFCRELGTAVGEIMFNRRTLVVATADVLAADDRSLARLTSLMEEMRTPELMALLNGDQIQVEGKGALLVALLAAQHRRANTVRVLRSTLPDDEDPGFLGAVIYRK